MLFFATIIRRDNQMDTPIALQPIVFDSAYENIADDESETINELSKALQSISDITSRDYDHAVRSVHAKCHGLLRGKLTVLPGLPEPFAQGIFSKPAEYPTMLRFSTSPGDILDDSISTPRGLAVKILGVEGARLSGNPTDNSQDFLLVNGPAFLKPDAKSFLSSLQLLAKTTNKAEGLKKVFSAVLRGTETVIETAGGKSPTIVSLGGHPETNILGETFYSQVPILYGRYMAKIAAFPASPELKALTNAPVRLNDAPNGLRDAVIGYFRENSAKWDLRIQLCTDLESMPIEDASVVWPEEESPFITVATLEVNPQLAWDDLSSPRIDDKLSFSPWNGISEHRPLGSVMRARKLTYENSSSFRKKFNGCPMAEIRSLEEL